MTAFTPVKLARRGSHSGHLCAPLVSICNNAAPLRSEVGRIAIALTSWSRRSTPTGSPEHGGHPARGDAAAPANDREMPSKRLAPAFDQLESFAMFAIKQLNYISRVRS